MKPILKDLTLEGETKEIEDGGKIIQEGDRGAVVSHQEEEERLSHQMTNRFNHSQERILKNRNLHPLSKTRLQHQRKLHPHQFCQISKKF
jgi:hypothetical protein